MLAIYTRVSDDESADNGLSLDNQATRGKERAAKLGIKYEIYEDGGYSGSIPFDKRPALNKLIKDIYNEKITAVYVIAQDMLSRGGIFQHDMITNIFKDEMIRYFGGEVAQILYDINN